MKRRAVRAVVATTGACRWPAWTIAIFEEREGRWHTVRRVGNGPAGDGAQWVWTERKAERWAREYAEAHGYEWVPGVGSLRYRRVE